MIKANIKTPIDETVHDPAPLLIVCRFFEAKNASPRSGACVLRWIRAPENVARRWETPRRLLPFLDWNSN